MSHTETSTRTLARQGSEERLRNLQRKFRAATPRVWLSKREQKQLRGLGRQLLIVYWLGCIAVIAAGVHRAFPDLWPRMQRSLPGPSADHPFSNCSAAHAAGVYDIPFWSPAYTSAQDGDGDGKACEPAPWDYSHVKD